MKYLIWSNEHRAWWRPNNNGYTTQYSQAGQYSEQEAIKICKDANLYLFDRNPNGNRMPMECMVPVTPIEIPEPTSDQLWQFIDEHGMAGYNSRKAAVKAYKSFYKIL